MKSFLLSCFLSLCSLLFIGTWFSCIPLEKEAGTSSGVDNPELTLVFTEDNIKTAVSGTLSVYHADHNPWLTDHAIFDTILVNEEEFTLTPSHITGGAMHKRSAEAIPELFNLVFLSGDKEKGAIGKSVVFHPGRNVFMQNGSLLDHVEMEIESMSTDTISWSGPNSHSLLYYLPGTPFRSEIKDGKQQIRLPEGVSIPLKTIPSSEVAPQTNPISNLNWTEIPVNKEVDFNLGAHAKYNLTYDTNLSNVWMVRDTFPDNFLAFALKGRYEYNIKAITPFLEQHEIHKSFVKQHVELQRFSLFNASLRYADQSRMVFHLPKESINVFEILLTHPIRVKNQFRDTLIIVHDGP